MKTKIEHFSSPLHMLETVTKKMIHTFWGRATFKVVLHKKWIKYQNCLVLSFQMRYNTFSYLIWQQKYMQKRKKSSFSILLFLSKNCVVKMTHALQAVAAFKVVFCKDDIKWTNMTLFLTFKWGVLGFSVLSDLRDISKYAKTVWRIKTKVKKIDQYTHIPDENSTPRVFY